MNVINVCQRSPEWHAWRAAGVTASEAAVILGRSPYKTQWRLWAERTGVATPEDLSRNPIVQRGIQFEDQARRGFEERHDTLLLPLCAESSEHPVLRASFDGLSDDGEPVELKVPHETTYRKVIQDGVESEPYRLSWVQVQAQLYVAGSTEGWLVFHQTPEVSTEFRITRDDAFINEVLVPACLAFWDAIETAKAPPTDPKRDLYVPIDEKTQTKWAGAAGEYRELAAKRRDLEQVLKDLKGKMAAAEDVFTALMGDYLLAETKGIRVTRYMQNGTVDYSALLKEMAPGVDESTLNRFRRQPSERVKVTLQG